MGRTAIAHSWQSHRRRNWLAVALFLLGWLLACLMPAAAQAQKLHFVQAIGRPDQSEWMGYVSFSADGRSIIADGLGDGGAIWSFPAGALLHRLAHRPYDSSPDLRYYSWDKGYGETDSGKVLFTAPGGNYGAFAFSPDSRFVVRSAEKAAAGDAIEVVKLRTGAVISRLGKRHPEALTMAPDDRTLASGYWDVIMLWDIPAGHRRKALRGMKDYVSALHFSPHGKRLAAGSDGGKVQLWNVATGQRIWSVQLPGGFVSKPAFSPDGTLVAVGTYGTGTVWLLRSRDGSLADQAKVSDLGCGAVAFSPDGRYLIVPSTGGLVKWPYDHGGTVRVFEVRR